MVVCHEPELVRAFRSNDDSVCLRNSTSTFNDPSNEQLADTLTAATKVGTSLTTSEARERKTMFDSTSAGLHTTPGMAARPRARVLAFALSSPTWHRVTVTAHRLASRYARASVPIRGHISERERSAGAASTPAWRIPPPRDLRIRLANVMNADDPANSDPTGAASPLERHMDTLRPHVTTRQRLLPPNHLSQSRTMSAGDTPRAAAALHRRAPSMCTYV